MKCFGLLLLGSAIAPLEATRLQDSHTPTACPATLGATVGRDSAGWFSDGVGWGWC